MVPLQASLRRRRAVMISLVVVLVAVLFQPIVAARNAPPAAAKAKITCKLVTGRAYADPIVFHNATGNVGHLHTFFGNGSLLALSNPNAANYRTLVGKRTNCENKADTAGYWTPTLMDTITGRLVPVTAFTAYYRSFDRRDFGAARAFPPDTRLVTKASKNTRASNWTCGQFAAQEPVSYIPDCSGTRPGDRLTAHVTFPSCWDGVRPTHGARDRGRTADNRHYAYRSSSGTCPRAFPHRMVELRVTIGFDYTGPGSNLMLTSDHEAGTTQGRSLHADFWNTWEQAGFERMVGNCITGGRLAPAVKDECG